MEHPSCDELDAEGICGHVYYGRILLSLYLDRAPWRHAVRIECCVYSSQQGEREHVYADRARRYSAWCCFPMDVLS